MGETNEPARFRLFIAVSSREAIKTQIEQAQEELRHALPAGSVRWTQREQFHLTLRFLGSVQAAQLEALIASVRATCQGFGPLQLRAEHVGGFPSLRSPRVIWAGV